MGKNQGLLTRYPQSFRIVEVSNSRHAVTPVQDASRHEDIVRRIKRDAKTNHGSFKEEVPDLLTYGFNKPPRGRKADRTLTAENLSSLRISGVDGFDTANCPSDLSWIPHLSAKTIAPTSASRNPKVCAYFISCPSKQQLISSSNYWVTSICRCRPSPPWEFLLLIGTWQVRGNRILSSEGSGQNQLRQWAVPGNGDEMIWSPILKECFNQKDSKQNGADCGSYTSLPRLLFQEFDSSSITLKYAERRAFLDLWLGIISFYLKIYCNIRFRPYLTSNGGLFLLSGTGFVAQCGQNDFRIR